MLPLHLGPHVSCPYWQWVSYCSDEARWRENHRLFLLKERGQTSHANFHIDRLYTFAPKTTKDCFFKRSNRSLFFSRTLCRYIQVVECVYIILRFIIYLPYIFDIGFNTGLQWHRLYSSQIMVCLTNWATMYMCCFKLQTVISVKHQILPRDKILIIIGFLEQVYVTCILK